MQAKRLKKDQLEGKIGKTVHAERSKRQAKTKNGDSQKVKSQNAS